MKTFILTKETAFKELGLLVMENDVKQLMSDVQYADVLNRFFKEIGAESKAYPTEIKEVNKETVKIKTGELYTQVSVKKPTFDFVLHKVGK